MSERPGDSGPAGSGSAGASGSLLASVTASTFLRDPRVVIARRDVASLSREKTIVLALFIQLFVAAFSSFLVVGLTSLYSPGEVSANEIVVGVTGATRSSSNVPRSSSSGNASTAIEPLMNGGRNSNRGTSTV